METTTVQVLRRSALASFLQGCVFVLSVPFVCLCGVPTAAALTLLLGRQLDGVLALEGRRSKRSMEGFGAVYLFEIGLVWAALGGSSAVEALAPGLATIPATALGTLLAGGAFMVVALPYAFTPLVARDPAVPSAVGAHTFLLSARAMAEVPLRRRLAIVVASGAAYLVPLLVFLLFERGRHLGWAVLGMAGALLVLVPLAGAVYVSAYGSVREHLQGSEPLEDDPVALPAVARVAAASAALSATTLLVMLLGAALTPGTMREADPQHRIGPGDPQPSPLPGSPDVLVRATGVGVTVAARDGGGVGLVASGCGEVQAVQVEVVGDGTFLVYARCTDQALRRMRVDGRGVRLDDGFGERIRARTGAFFWVLTIVAALLWVLGLGGPLRSLQRVRFLRTLARTDDPGPSLEELRVLEGTLRTGEPVTLSGGTFQSTGGAQIIGAGSLRVALPSTGPALPLDEESLYDGAVVAIVGRFERGVGGGLREGARAWPVDGLLVSGGRRAAAETLTRRASRRFASLLALLTLAQVTAAIVLLLSW